MKILAIYHNYGSSNPSGETLAFKQEISLLNDAGFDVTVYEKETDAVLEKTLFQRIVEFLLVPYNPFEYLKIRKIIKKGNFEAVHIYNTWPFISIAAFHAAGTSKVIVTAPNYRFGCPAGVPQRNGEVCTLCMDRRNVLYALKYKCYRNSYLMSAIAAVNTYFLRTFAISRINRAIVLTEFQYKKFISLGFSKDQLSIKPTPRIEVNLPYKAYNDREIDIIYVGRLSEEKGIYEWLEENIISIQNENLKVKIVGEGPLRHILTTKYQNCPNIELLGRLDQHNTHSLMCQSKLIVVPSRWFEGLPLVLQESFEFGTPVAVSNVGPLPEIVAPAKGIILDLANLTAGFSEIVELIKNRDLWEQKSQSAREYHASEFNAKKNIAKLISVYKS